MLAADVAIVDIDAAHWANWLDLLIPPRLRRDTRVGLVVLDRGAPIKAIVSGSGAVDVARVPLSGTSPAALDRVARALGVTLLVVMERAAIIELGATIERELELGMDFVVQGLVVLRALQRLSGRGLWLSPPILDLVPAPPADALQATFDLLCADGASLVAYVIEDDASGVHASLIAVKRRGHVELVTTHRGIDDAVAGRVLARDWRRLYRRVNDTVADRYARPSLAMYLERSAFYRVASGPSDQLGRELTARNIIIDPAPAWLLGLLGGATVAAAAGRSARVLARMLPSPAQKMASSLAGAAGSMLRDTASPFALLGFDPLELWRRVRHLYRAPERARR